MKKLTRQILPEQTSFRAFEEDGKRYLEGYASVFGQRSKQLFENNKLFYEIIDRAAFDEALQREDLNVILTFNHERDKVLARTKSGTLILSTDETGLRFRAEVPNTTLGNDIYELVSRGDLFENSFAFIARKQDEVWTKDEQGNEVKTLLRITKLYDVSVVVDGAYSNTDVFARDEDEVDDAEDEVKPDERLEPTPGDNEDEFISECVSYVMENGETSDPDQAYAICKTKWDESRSNKEEVKEDVDADLEKLNDELERMRMHVKLLELKYKN